MIQYAMEFVVAFCIIRVCRLLVLGVFGRTMIMTLSESAATYTDQPCDVPFVLC